jgi:hypothetical protein
MQIMDNIWNLQFGKRKGEERIPPEAFSEDGYLIHQGLITQVRYGRKTTKEIGCGWISCYNYLHYMGSQAEPLEVAHEMERMLLWGGFRGNHPVVPWIYLRRKGYRTRIALTKRGLKRLLNQAEKSRKETGQKVAGILAYGHATGSHFATFIREEDEKSETGESGKVGGGTHRYRFLNVIYGKAHSEWTIEEFFQKHVTKPICFAIVAAPQKQKKG